MRGGQGGAVVTMATERLSCRRAAGRQQHGRFRAGSDEIIHVGKRFLSPSPDIFWASVPPHLEKGLRTGSVCLRGFSDWALAALDSPGGGECSACFCPIKGVSALLPRRQALFLLPVPPTPVLPPWPGSRESSVGKDELWAWK